MEIPSNLRDPEKQALDGLAEVLADQDDALLEKLIEEVAPTSAELYQQLRKDQASGTIVEVLLRWPRAGRASCALENAAA